jgi:hypothetical protein
MRTTENDLINPALRLLADAERPEIGLTTAELARQLRNMIQATQDDLESLRGRKDDRLSQVIRNLVSHRTLERRGLATYYKNERTGRAYYRLTAMGFKTLQNPAGHTPISK